MYLIHYYFHYCVLCLDTSAQIPFRENFAQTCFELLLKISFMEGQANTSYSG